METLKSLAIVTILTLTLVGGSIEAMGQAFTSQAAVRAVLVK